MASLTHVAAGQTRPAVRSPQSLGAILKYCVHSIVLLLVGILAASCGEPERYGYDLPPAHADAFTPIGAASNDVGADSAARRMRRVVLGEILEEPSLLLPAPGLTVRTLFMERGDSLPSWVAVRVAEVGDTTLVSRSEFAIGVYTEGEERRLPVVSERPMTSQEMAAFRDFVQAAEVWSMPPHIPKVSVVDTTCADCAPQPLCEIELRNDSRYYLVHRSHRLIGGDTVGLGAVDRRFYALCRFLWALSGGV